MYYDEEFKKNVLENINSYKGINCYDFSDIEKKRKKVIYGNKDLYKDLSKVIDLDFIRESEETENISDPELSKFLKDPQTKIIKYVPLDMLSLNKDLLNNEEYEEKEIQLYSKVKLFAVNPILKKEVFLSYSSHLYALKKLFREAYTARKYEIKHPGKEIPLEQSSIIETNELLFQGTLNENSQGIGCYRSPYTSGFTFIDGAKIVPTSSGKVCEHMDALLEWYNGKESKRLHPIERASIFHAEFLRCHPFSDGNGRTARLLFNYELIKRGYPSIVIKARDKKKYIFALKEAQENYNIKPLVELTAGYLTKTEEKYIQLYEEVKNLEKNSKEK